jgi:hypothetical protein
LPHAQAQIHADRLDAENRAMAQPFVIEGAPGLGLVAQAMQPAQVAQMHRDVVLVAELAAAGQGLRQAVERGVGFAELDQAGPRLLERPGDTMPIGAGGARRRARARNRPALGQAAVGPEATFRR